MSPQTLALLSALAFLKEEGARLAEKEAALRQSAARGDEQAALQPDEARADQAWRDRNGEFLHRRRED